MYILYTYPYFANQIAMMLRLTRRSSSVHGVGHITWKIGSPMGLQIQRADRQNEERLKIFLIIGNKKTQFFFHSTSTETCTFV